jgi:hypothetical protein
MARARRILAGWRGSSKETFFPSRAPITAAIVVTWSEISQLDAPLQLTWKKLARLFAQQSNINSKVY